MNRNHKVGSKEDWLAARLELLTKEKELTRFRDEPSRMRRALPWVPLGKDYTFESPSGSLNLSDLFNGHSQLIVYHFMFEPDWEEGCLLCSFWADCFDGVLVHLANHDVSLACISRAPAAKLQAYKKRMGWRFPWVSSLHSDFNFDFGVSFAPSLPGQYNYAPHEGDGDSPGLSAFATDAGTAYHTYSGFARGLDAINVAYQLLDLAPRGRDEDGLPWPMAWVRRHDSYDRGEV